MDNQELWKDIIDYETFYQVSNFGNVRSLDRIVSKPNGISYMRKGKLCVQSKSNLGYMTVGFTVNNKKVNKYVHRLVAEAFISNPQNKPCVNHIDCNSSNNHISNLSISIIIELEKTHELTYIYPFVWENWKLKSNDNT
jgi:hypothetical protein